jgi:D-tyrosyl-tRNA(Tyr) deacylase
VVIGDVDHSAIGKGLLVLLGVKSGDSDIEADAMAERCSNIRVFDDSEGKMNLSVQDIDGSVMVVSQFTLYGDARRGNRPSYSEAAEPKEAERLYQRFLDSMIRVLGSDRVASGVFRATMRVELVNDGPVTIQLESKSNNPSA